MTGSPHLQVRVKVCGLTNAEDALAAVAAGADAVGFVFYAQSPRCIAPLAAWEIIRRLPPIVSKVGVFVNAAASSVRLAVSSCGLDTVQFHGEETPEFCAAFHPLKVIKAFRIRDAASLAGLGAYGVPRAAEAASGAPAGQSVDQPFSLGLPPTDAWLLDSFVPGELGGTGTRFNWDLACAAGRHGVPIILAGGLTAENVAGAIQRVRPFGVDVSSGVELSPGRKDHDKLRRFVSAARQAAREPAG